MLFVIISNRYIYYLLFKWISFFVFISWILSYLRFADKDKSNTMTKAECHQLLINSLNIKLPEEIFEKLFHV